ncbi:MAG: PfkB family carbohydrate kinase, partial [Candidatus Puniceispirillum sp.]
ANATKQLGSRVNELIVTRGAKGASIFTGAARHDVPAMPQGDIVDTTGAGDLFAAGYLFGRTNGHNLMASATLASLAAGEVISHIGARPQMDLKRLI